MLDQLPKLLDTLIKAPLWLFFAGAIACGVPLLSFPALVNLGVRADMALGPLPIAFIFIAFGALFVSSAFARGLKPVAETLGEWAGAAKWWLRLGRLSAEARALLSVIEEEAMSKFYCVPTEHAVRELRDLGILRPELVGDDLTWGTYAPSREYVRACARLTGLFRRRLRTSPEHIESARSCIRYAAVRAKRLV